jgi:heptosyltransferase-2
MTPLNPDAVRRILFVRTDRLGETLLNLPAIAAIRAALPEAAITLLVDPSLVDLLSAVPEADEVLAYPSGGRGTWWSRSLAAARALSGRRFDAAIISNPKKELHLAAWLARIPRRIGYDRKWGGLLTDRVPDLKALGDRHEVQYNLDLVQALGVTASVPAWQFPPFDGEQREVRELLEGQGVRRGDPFLAVHPWTSHPRKQWPLDRFREMIQRLAQVQGWNVVVIGAGVPPDRLRALLPAVPRIVDLVDRLSLRQLAGLLQGARLLVSNDSGPVHLAAAVGTPVVALFASSDAAAGPARWGPWGEGHTVIWKPSLEAIEVDEVFAAVMQASTKIQ